MRKQTDQADFFTLMCSLFAYIVSGKSHVGPMSNNPGNPFVTVPVLFPRSGPEIEADLVKERTLYDCVVVKSLRTRDLEENSEGELDGEEEIEEEEEAQETDLMMVDSE